MFSRCIYFVPTDSLTASPGEHTFEVKIVSPGEQFTRIWTQVLDRHDGSFLVRYRMYATYPSLHIHILHENKHVSKSPYILKGQWTVQLKSFVSDNSRLSLTFLCPSSVGPVYHEGCNCPQPSAPVWEAHMHCPQSFPQIKSDLSHFANVDPDRNAQEIPQRFGQRQSLCHYTVKDNKVNYTWNDSYTSAPFCLFTQLLS